MLEGFKLNALKLKRTLKISVSLPQDYNYTNDSYPVLLCLDGQDLFNFILEDTQKIDFNNLIKEQNKSLIAIGIQAPKIPEWRISEFNQYYNGDSPIVEKYLAPKFGEYLSTELIPLLKEKYRTNKIYLLGFYEGAIQAIDMYSKYDNVDGAFALSPKLLDCDMDIFTMSIKEYYHLDKPCYLSLGGNDSSTTDLNRFMSIYTTLDSLKCTKVELLYDEKKNNDYEALKEELINILNIITK